MGGAEGLGVLRKGAGCSRVGVLVDGLFLRLVLGGEGDAVGEADGEVKFGVMREGRDGIEVEAGVVEGCVEVDGGVGVGGGV